MTIDRKARLQLPPQLPPERPPAERLHDFDEVTLPYDPETAIAEAQRCLQCANAPCQNACPLGNNIPRALALLSEGEILAAAAVYHETSPMPEICGRICPEQFCQEACVLNKRGQPIHTRHLEAFIADYARQHAPAAPPKIAPTTGKRVAIVGSGPAGLTVAELLARQGHHIDVYEQYPMPGGLLQYGIPTFKLSAEHVQAKIAELEALGVTFHCNVTVGEDLTVPALQAEYDAVFLGIGAQQHFRPGLPGEELAGIYNATEFLTRTNVAPELLPPAWRAPLEIGAHVHVLGGGGTAMDCLRTALRLPQVETATCYYRRSEEEMPSPPEDHRHALEEGGAFVWLAGPIEFLGDEAGHVRAVTYQRMTLCEPDESGRCRPVPIPGDTITVPADTVVMALGYSVDDACTSHITGLTLDRKYRIVVDSPQTGRTSVPGLFAAGDIVRGADLAAPAIADARGVAHTIAAYLRGETA